MKLKLRVVGKMKCPICEHEAENIWVQVWADPPVSVCFNCTYFFWYEENDEGVKTLTSGSKPMEKPEFMKR